MSKSLDNDSTTPQALLAADREDFSRLSDRTAQMLGEYLNALPDEAVQRVIPDDVRELLSTLSLPKQGMNSSLDGKELG